MKLLSELAQEVAEALCKGTRIIHGKRDDYYLMHDNKGRRFFEIGKYRFTEQDIREKTPYGVLARNYTIHIMRISKYGRYTGTGVINGKYIDQDIEQVLDELVDMYLVKAVQV